MNTGGRGFADGYFGRAFDPPVHEPMATSYCNAYARGAEQRRTDEETAQQNSRGLSHAVEVKRA